MHRACSRVCVSTGLLLSLVAGCSSSSESPPPKAETVVTGKVTYDGQPVWEGQVLFLGAQNRLVTSPIAEDGSYRIVNPPLGRVRVAVTNHPRTINTTPPLLAKVDRPGLARTVVPLRPFLTLPSRYGEAYESGLTFEVEAGANEYPLVLVRREGDPAYLPRSAVPSVGVDPGQIAPDIVGEDLEGQTFRLHEYRGKIIALLFWGYW